MWNREVGFRRVRNALERVWCHEESLVWARRPENIRTRWKLEEDGRINSQALLLPNPVSPTPPPCAASVRTAMIARDQSFPPVRAPQAKLQVLSTMCHVAFGSRE